MTVRLGYFPNLTHGVALVGSLDDAREKMRELEGQLAEARTAAAKVAKLESDLREAIADRTTSDAALTHAQERIAAFDNQPVGMSEADVRKSGRPAMMAVRAMTRVSRAIEKSETAGFISESEASAPASHPDESY